MSHRLILMPDSLKRIIMMIFSSVWRLFYQKHRHSANQAGLNQEIWSSVEKTINERWVFWNLTMNVSFLILDTVVGSRSQPVKQWNSVRCRLRLHSWCNSTLWQRVLLFCSTHTSAELPTSYLLEYKYPSKNLLQTRMYARESQAWRFECEWNTSVKVSLYSRSRDLVHRARGTACPFVTVADLWGGGDIHQITDTEDPQELLGNSHRFCGGADSAGGPPLRWGYEWQKL